MKLKIVPLTVVLVLASHSATASWFKGGPSKKDTPTIERLQREIDDLESENNSLKAENERLKDENEELRKTIADRKGEDVGSSTLFGKWFVVIPILFGLGFFVLRRKKPSSHRAQNAFEDQRPKCPRCGQEHNPGDTICKNPNCRTQF
jgi:hypothetical protein